MLNRLSFRIQQFGNLSYIHLANHGLSWKTWTLKKLQRFLICSITNLISFEKTVVIQACTKTRNSDTKRPKRNNWNKWNYRNDKNKTIERLFRFGSFASTLSLRLFRFGRFESLFRVLVHAWITTKQPKRNSRNETTKRNNRNSFVSIVLFWSFR